MMKVLITGPSGCGKTTIAQELKQNGFNAYSADSVLAEFYDTELKRYVPDATRQPDEAWRNRYKWLWHPDKLNNLLKTGDKQPIFICGVASNTLKFVNNFDKVFLLKIDKQTTESRLLKRTNNDFGKHPDELRHVLTELEAYQQQFINAGATPLNGRLPTSELIGLILDEIQQ